MVSLDHLTSQFSPYNYCFYFLKDWFNSNLFPLTNDGLTRIFQSPSDQAFLIRSTKRGNNSELDFPFLSIYPRSMKDENNTFRWSSLARTQKVLYREDNYTVKYQNALLDFQCVYFTTDGFDEIMRLATVMELIKKQNITYKWTIETSVPLEPGVMIPITITVPIHVTLKDIDLNPVWNESDWLTQNKIYTLDCSVIVQTLKPIIEIKTSSRIELIEIDLVSRSGLFEETNKLNIE